ncbi:hypothetical protein TRAPUB_14019 [Trametes pubescens]|uniref:Uncharacterized protein n=1 Tax=Trametes pubescens TaxID=154538 RepID=A0A1M2VPP5_TRAPU|nr:hypothetical protein TRAPUB_14019 [Trametes pubescens]
MSPSPTPQPLPPEPSTSTLPEHHFSFESNALHNPSITDYSMQLPRTSSPEPLDYSELQAMRARVQECALSHNAREAEFAAMLAETQSRFSTLERELSRLRPLLSLHATILRDPQLWEPENYPTIVVERHGRDSHEAGQTAHEVTTAAEAGAELQGNDGAHQTHSSQAPRALSSKHQVRKARERPRKHRHRHSIAASRPLLADARSEFILVAARKLGRLRAGILSGFVKERAKYDRQSELLPTTNTYADRNSRHEPPPSPTTSRPHPSVLDGDAGSSSPPVPLAASRQRQGSSSKTTQRRLAPSPFAPGAGGAAARPAQMPTHLHPSAQAYPVAAQGRHPQAMPHPGFVYFAPGPGQSGTMPLVVPVPWAVPGTPPGSGSGQIRQTHGQATPLTGSVSKIKTPARAHAGGAAGEGSSTPMDSLVSAARTLIEDEDYDGDEAEAGGSGAAPVTDTEATAEEDTVPEDTPLRRRGTRRRAAADASDSPAPKRRRTTATAAGELAAPSIADPNAKKPPRRVKAAAAPSHIQEKPKARGRAKGKGKQKAATPPLDSPPSPASTSAPPPVAPTRVPHAPQVARIPSALDVLADQAAQEQGRWPSLDAASRRDSESEGREEDAIPEAMGTPTTPARDPVDDDVFAPQPEVTEPSPGGEREPAVEPPEAVPTSQDAAAAPQEDADVKHANGGEAAPARAVDVPETAASRLISDEEPVPVPEATPRQPHASPPQISSPPLLPPSSPTLPSSSFVPPSSPGHPPTSSTPRAAQQPESPRDSPSPLAIPAVADSDTLLIVETTVPLNLDPADVPPPRSGSGDEPGGAPREIESSDEDAEGSIVDFDLE